MSKNTEQAHNQNILRIINKYLDNPSRLYSGIEIKKYLKKYLFSLTDNDLSNPLKAGRWSAYCHYDLSQSLENILSKHQLSPDQNILSHPLLNKNLVDVLIKNQLNIFSLDIDKNTLNWKMSALREKILEHEKNNLPLSLVIQICHNGLADEIIENIELLELKHIPSVLIIADQVPTPSVLKAITKMKYGSVIINGGKSFWDKKLNEVIKDKSFNNDWYFSWFIENRASSTLEYHLRDSYRIFEQLLNAYNYLFTKKTKTTNWFLTLSKLFDVVFTEKGSLLNIFKPKFKNPEEATKIIKKYYSVSMQLAVSDLPFDIELYERENSQINDHTFVIDKWKEQVLEYQIQAKYWQQFFSSQIQQRPQGSLEIPVYYYKKIYSKYFLYSTEQQFWQGNLQTKGVSVKVGFQIHDIFSQANGFDNAKFASQFLLWI
jgi:hypothetical protein